ncbi:hypothetical protein [Tenacibaculum sp.]|uniref:hypothetical protein n=1 Tax=Tenacibaculum sp. TaxID=1906242 RepID=UPI003D12A718
MKKLFVLAFVTLMSTSVFSTNDNPEKEQIRTKIVQLLGKPNFVLDKDVKTTVELLITKNGEIIILDIDCDTLKIHNYIKSKLNHKTIDKNLELNNSIYKMPLTIKKQN